jgi:KaiC/GvpD/RAD55 family RecA-like ATPase
LDKVDVKLLLDQAKELEKKYWWLDAVDTYKKASDLAVKSEDFLKAIDIYERIAYAFCRAALQAETKKEFKNRMKLSAKAYQNMIKLLDKMKTAEAKRVHARAMVAWTYSRIEDDFAVMATLLDQWWSLENSALDIYQKEGDLLAIGRSCNDLMEGSLFNRLFLSAEEFVERALSGANLGEKAIKALLKTDNDYDLARAYFLTAWHYGIISYYYVVRTDDQTRNLKALIQDWSKKWHVYSDRALSLAETIGDSWLIGWAHDTKGLGMNRQMPLNLLLNHAKKELEYGKLTKDNYLMSKGFWEFSMFTVIFSGSEEDPEKRRLKLKQVLEWSEEALRRFRIIAFHTGILISQNYYVICLNVLASLGLSLGEKRKLLQRAVEIGRESYEYVSRALNHGQTWANFSLAMDTLSQALFLLAKTETLLEEKRRLLEEALKIRKEVVSIQSRVGQSIGIASVFSYTGLAHTLCEKAKISATTKEKIQLLNKAVLFFEEGLEKLRRQVELNLFTHMGQALQYGRFYVEFGRILTQFYEAKGERKLLEKAIAAYKHAALQFQKEVLPTHSAEIEWSIAKLQNRSGDCLEAAAHYKNAGKEYEKASEKVPRLKDFYQDYSLYMNAWSQIERARSFHSAEQYNKARNHYEEAAKLHESTEHWSYLAPNYFAWASMEEAEDLSRNEKTQQAKHAFQEALQQFSLAKESIKQKLEETTTSEEKEMIQKLFEASELRRKYCQARIHMEKAKLLDREAKHLQSSTKYSKAARNISEIVDKLDVEAERKELEYIAILCQAWEKMANAEETTSSESYLEAATLFEQARDSCYTKKASLWALGNSSFCKGLAAGLRYKSSMDLKENALAKQYFKDAASSYFKAGFKSASEYAKATQRLFDAYAFMNQAENELDQEKRAKQYQMAENLLQIAAGSFMKAKQPEKTAQVQDILANVREEKTLAISLSQVMKAPTIASTTLSFTAPTPTSETSVGLESFEHANVQANLIAAIREVKVGESFCLSVEFVNAGREPALLMHVEDFVPLDFVVVKKPEMYRIEDTTLNMKGKQLAPLKLVEVKLTVQPSKKGKYQLNPKVQYLDELGQNKSLQLRTLEIIVEEVRLEDRVSTGTQELDSLLLGGIPSEYAIVLTGPPSDEREYLIRNFLEAGIKEDETVFYVSTEAYELETLIKKSNFHLFLCNPKPKTKVPHLPNVYKLHSKTDITNLSISLAKAYRNIYSSKKKRICVDIVSDVLVDYETKATRKWVSELITDLGSKGFTMLAVINPDIHPHDQARAIIDLFDGEINLIETEDPLECRKSIRVRKLRNQDYIKNPICLT